MMAELVVAESPQEKQIKKMLVLNAPKIAKALPGGRLGGSLYTGDPQFGRDLAQAASLYDRVDLDSCHRGCHVRLGSGRTGGAMLSGAVQKSRYADSGV